ncbi:helix-turn-helix domain-containing protein [Pedobacter sp. AW31-3R]|uniref:helix-turn-helix domain-containing protein n=1 Tax=Pedobacter sp. AW31-3R TaxID=3445781 RepID=UPI003FA13796
MEVREDMIGFYQRIDQPPYVHLTPGSPHINVFERASCVGIIPYSRRDYYKVSLIMGKGYLEFADKVIPIDRPALMFSNPMLPYHWQPESPDQQGWFCIFNEAFIRQRDELLTELPMFQLDTDKVYYPAETSVLEISFFFHKMMEENQGNYAHKQDILRNYLHLIVHHALKMEPARNYEQGLNASARITSLFIELLSRQFPIDSRQNELKLRSAKDFADQLAVHTNHLNRAVKEVTGKTTTEHIATRILLEANDLLRHSDWAIAEIGYCLGFDYPGYFNTFYKKYTGRTPRDERKHLV